MKTTTIWTWIGKNYYDLIITLALITLALTASYGVYRYQLLFVPNWVAITSATSFELTYIGLALARLTLASRQRASIISLSAVTVSILYNGLSSFIQLAPDALDTGRWQVAAVLAALHGLPLALLAYFVADLIIHQSTRPARHNTSSSTQAENGAQRVTEEATQAPTGFACSRCDYLASTQKQLNGHQLKHRNNNH